MKCLCHSHKASERKREASKTMTHTGLNEQLDNKSLRESEETVDPFSQAKKIKNAHRCNIL